MNEPIDTLKYKGYTIEIHYDDSPVNPWLEWDCEPPIIVVGDRNLQDQLGLDKNPPPLTAEQIRQHSKAIAATLGCAGVTVQDALDEVSVYVGDWTDPDDINDALAEHAGQLTGRDLLEFLAAIHECAGNPAVVRTVRGSSQSDWADVLAVATPEWLEKTGAPAESVREQLENTVKLYGQWAFGEMYGWTVPATADSCWGYFGHDWATNGLQEAAQEAIDAHIEVVKQMPLVTLDDVLAARMWQAADALTKGLGEHDKETVLQIITENLARFDGYREALNLTLDELSTVITCKWGTL